MDYRQHAFDIFDFQILHLQLNTPLFILALVLVLMASLHWLLFRPVLRTLDGRQRELERLTEDTEREKAKLAALVEQYKRDLDRVRGEVERVRQQGHGAAQQAQEQVLEQARQDAARHLQQDVRQARATMGRIATSLAEQTTQRMLSA
jgi:F0F1-type ATP synthase membrane subunit b/b'